MNEIIKVTYDNDRPTTSARDLWEYLDRPYTEFLKWFNQYKDYGFAENQDFRALRVKIRTAQGNEVDSADYEITVDMAKELCMLQKSEKGKQARQYFIELEKRWNSPEAVMARALQMADKKLLQLQGKIEEDKPLVIFAETCAASQNSVLVRELAKVASKHGLTIGERRLYAKLREWKLIFRHSTEPYQEYVDRGYFEITQSPKETARGVQVYRTTRVTTKGQIYIINRLKQEVI